MRDKIQTGDIMTITHYVKVEKQHHSFYGDELDVVDIDAKDKPKLIVKGLGIIDKMESADKFTSDKQLTKTELAAKFIRAGRKVFTVTFEKADGSYRVLRGRLIRSEPLLGRSYVEDLDKPLTENRKRLVDHRTLRQLVISDVRYTLKGTKNE